MFINSDKKRRLTLDVIGQLEDDLEKDPLDYQKWTKLIQQVLAKDKEEQVRKVFDQYLSIFKFDGKQWCNYINYLLNRGELQEVVLLFSKCLPDTDNVELCRLYVSYVRRTNDIITGGEKARGVVVKAFEFAINKVGIDIRSGELWKDYLEFLKAWTPAASWEQQQKVDLIRNVYKRFLVIPTENVELAWSGYTKWENDVNSSTASKFIAEKSTEFMDARSWNTEWHNVTERQLNRSIIPSSLTRGDKKYVKNQLNLWYNWLALEKQNKLNLKDDSLVQHRIEYFYKQAVAALPFVPELWFKYNVYLLRSNSEANFSKCLAILNEGLTLNPKSFLLTFQLSEMYEQDNNVERAKEVINNLITDLKKDHTALQEEIKLITDRKINDSHSNEDEQDKNKSDGDREDETNNKDEEELLGPKSVFQLSEDDAQRLVQLRRDFEELNKALTLIYIKLMMCCKRTTGITDARSVFKQARTDFESIGHEFYVENALMEYHSNNLKIASKVFNVGMKYFKKDGDFLLAYLDFLIMINKGENIKVLFEQGLSSLLQDLNKDNEELNEIKNSGTTILEKEKLESIKTKQSYIKQLIKKFSRYQSVYGDLELVKSLDSRYEEYFQTDDSIDLFSDRYRGHSIDVINKYDLGRQPEKRKNDSETYEDDLNGKAKKRKALPPVSAPSIPEKPTDLGQPPSNPTIPAPPKQQNPQNFVGLTTYNLLRLLPNSSYFGPPSDHVFNSEKLVELFGNLPNIFDS